MSTIADQQVRLLGPVDIQIRGRHQPVAGVRRKAVLAALAVSAGRAVGTETLVAVVWSGDAPGDGREHVAEPRFVPPGPVPDPGLDRRRAARLPAGARVTGDATDLRVAERLIAQAAPAPDAAERARALRSALALWRSRALADLTGLAWFDAQAERIERLRADAFGSLVDARLGLGEHAALVPELEELGSSP